MARMVTSSFLDTMAGAPRSKAPHSFTMSAPRGFEEHFVQEQFDTQQANRQQLLDLLGLSSQTVGPGGLLGQPFFQSILGNTLPDVVGGVSGALSPVLGGGVGGGGAAPTSLFGQLLAGRGALGGEIMEQLAGFGDSQRDAIQRQASNLAGTNQARLAARGLAGSTLASGAQTQAAEFEQRAMGELEDQLIGQRVNALQQIGEGIFGDVGSEMDRQLQGRGQTIGLLSNLLGSAFNL